MLKKVIKMTSILILVGFSFFYTEKVTKIAREKDPIMIEINNAKKNIYVSSIDPIINNDEYTTGINGCEINVDKSFSKMKNVGEYKEELLVMNEVENKKKIKNKYIVSGNKVLKKVSIVFLINDSVSEDLISFLSSKNIPSNFFISSDFIDDNLITIRFISENNNIYYYGDNGVYKDEYMLYNNNLLSLNSSNESSYCLVKEKDKDTLNLCTDYNMKTIKGNFISEDVYANIKRNLSNGSILIFDTNEIDEIKASINYITSKGYEIVSLDNLLDETNKCE